MTTSLSIKGGVLWIQGKAIGLPHPVVDVKVLGETVVAKVESEPGDIFNRNVYAFSSDGELLWQIEESPHGAETDKPYVDIGVDNSGKLVAGNWNGVDYFVDIKTGKIATKDFKK